MKIGLQTWGSEGDVRPFVALAGGLRAAGHDVSLVITSVENKDYSQYARAMDISISHVGKKTYDNETLREITRKIFQSRNLFTQIKYLFEFAFNPVVPEMFEAAQKLCSESDLVIGHFLHHPLQAAAEKSGTPLASISLNHGLIISKHAAIHGTPDFVKWMNPYLRIVINAVFDRLYGPEVNKLRTSVDLPPLSNLFDRIGRTELNLLPISSVLCRRQPDWPGHHEICGFISLPDASDDWTMPSDLKVFIDSGPPPIYMTIGSMMSVDADPKNMTEMMAQGALLAGCRAIVQSRWDELPDFPDHKHIYKIQRAPHQHIFPHCAAVVHHGGAGTTHSTIRHGRPSVVIEHFADQPLFAEELKRLGVAPTTLHRRSISAKKLSSAIRAVLSSPHMKARAEALSVIMQQEDGVKRAVELIEARFAPASNRDAFSS